MFFLFRKVINYRMRLLEKSGASFLPPLKRLFKRMFLFPFIRFHGLSFEVMLGVTYQCQCQCEHCGMSSCNNDQNSELNTLQIKEIIREISEIPYFFIKISFFGGEPMLRNDIFELINYAAGMGLFTDMNSNGICLSLDNVKKLKKSGLHHIYVSMDSADDCKHDAMRQSQGCYQKVINGIKNCVKMKLPCSVSTYVSKESISNGDLVEIIEKSKSLGAVAVRLLYPIFSGKLLNEDSRRLTWTEKDRVFKLLQPGFVYLESPDCCYKKSLKHCAAMQKKFCYISPQGNVQPCSFVPVIYGNLMEKRLQKVLAGMWGNKFFLGTPQECFMDNHSYRQEYGIGLKSLESKEWKA